MMLSADKLNRLRELIGGAPRKIALLCHTLVASTGPQRIAIGGGVLQRQPHLLDRIDPLLRDSIAGYLAVPPAPYVVAPALGDLAGPLGPIAMAMDALDLAAA